VLANATKQNVLLRDALVNAHEFIGDSIESYETAKQRIEALAATDDLAGLILCDAEPAGYLFVVDGRVQETLTPTEVEQEIFSESPELYEPLYKARKQP
jgi:hypothetical protein